VSTRAVAPTVAAPVAVVTPLQRPMLQRTCDCGEHTGGGECEECKKKKKMPLQRHGNGVPGPAVAPPLVRDVLRSSGQALDEETQTYFSSRFGYDFSQVRVHSDERAADSAQAVNAHAYTVGRHVVFGSGRYAPHTPRGRTLLSHELSHVVQQTASPYIGGSLEIGEAHDAAEREAEQAERTVVAEPVRVRQASEPRVQGKWDWGRAGWGALAGAGIGGAVLGGAGLLGAAGLGWFALGALGAVVAGFLYGGLTGKDDPEKKPDAQQPPPPGCSNSSCLPKWPTMPRSTWAPPSAA